jgi:hypothetical protein
MAHADVAEPIEHALVRKNVAGSYRIFDDRLVHDFFSMYGLCEFG